MADDLKQRKQDLVDIEAKMKAINDSQASYDKRFKDELKLKKKLQKELNALANKQAEIAKEIGITEKNNASNAVKELKLKKSVSDTNKQVLKTEKEIKKSVAGRLLDIIKLDFSSVSQKNNIKKQLTSTKKLQETQLRVTQAIQTGKKIEQETGKVLEENNRFSQLDVEDKSKMIDLTKGLVDGTYDVTDLQSTQNSLSEEGQKVMQDTLAVGVDEQGKLEAKSDIMKTIIIAKKAEGDMAEGIANEEERIAKYKQIQQTLTVGIVAIFASLVAVALKFANKIDEIGSSFGSLNVLGENFQDTLIAQGNSVTAIGGSLTDVASITNNLASSFGMNVDEAAKLSGKVFDTGKALGISADEASNLFGVLMTVGGLTAKQTEELTEGAFQLARQAGVAPAQVMKDIAGSAETVAIFTKDGGKNLLEAAISARQLGISIDAIAKSARDVLNFEDSIAKEMTASVLTGTQLDLQKARQLSLSKDIAGFEQEIRKQIQLQGDFGSKTVFAQEALADALGMSVSEVSRISQGLDDVSIKGALAANNFEDLVGRDSMSNISGLIGSFKQLGAILTDALGKGLEDSVGGLKDFLANTDNVDKLKESFTSIGVTIGSMVTQFSEFLKNSGGIEAMASGIMGFVNGLAQAVKWLPILIGGLVAAKGAAIAFSIATSLAALTKSAMTGGIVGVVGVTAALIAGYATLKALTPTARTGMTGFSGGEIMVGESGPERVSLPRGSNVTGAEHTRQMAQGQNFGKIESALERLVSINIAGNEQRGNQRIIGRRGELAIASEPQRGGLSLGIV